MCVKDFNLASSIYKGRKQLTFERLENNSRLDRLWQGKQAGRGGNITEAVGRLGMQALAKYRKVNTFCELLPVGSTFSDHLFELNQGIVLQFTVYTYLL